MHTQKQPYTDFPFRLQRPSGLSVQVNANGSIRRIDYRDIMLNLFLGTEVEGGPANIFLRRRTGLIEAVPLIGPCSSAHVRFGKQSMTARGNWQGINFRVSLVLADAAPAWFWHVMLGNTGSAAETVDLVYAQDLAISDYGAVRLNEYYVSPYVDHAPLSHPQAGWVVASRQNLSVGGRNPLTVIGSLAGGVSYATDALQVYGPLNRAGSGPLVFVQELPGCRLQHEHSMVAIQDGAVELRPGTVAFIDIQKPLLGKPQEIERHKDPNEWLRSLKPGHAIRAWLMYQSGNQAMPPGHQLAGFAGGGGTWQLHVAGLDRTETWLPRWEVTRRDDPDTRIWSVTYGCVARVPGKPAIPEPRLDLITSRLAASLNALHEFASVHDLAFWAGLFQRAADCLDPSLPAVFPDYIQFVCLDSYPEPAHRLLAAAYAGWAFGGMGSGNDLGFEPDAENDRYNRLSAELYSAVTDAIQQAAWSFGKDAPKG